MSRSTHRLAHFVVIVCGLFGLACFGDFCQDATSTVVETTVKGSKQVTKGIVEGVQNGRKAGESVDGANIVTSFDELQQAGSVEVYAIKSDGPGASTLEVAATNTSQTPLRMSGMQWTVLDDEGFTMSLTRAEGEKTIPPGSKDKLVLAVALDPDDVSVVRLWGVNLDIREGARRAGPAAND